MCFQCDCASKPCMNSCPCIMLTQRCTLSSGVLHQKDLCVVQYSQVQLPLRLNMLYYHQYIVIVSMYICCVVSLAYNVALWRPPCLSLYSICLYMRLFVYAHSYQKMMECWPIEPDERSLFKQLKSDLDKLLMIHLSDGCITFSEVDEDKLPYCKQGASNSETLEGQLWRESSESPHGVKQLYTLTHLEINRSCLLWDCRECCAGWSHLGW